MGVQFTSKMPRTTKVECPGCPPIRALTFDVLGLVKVIEAHGKQGGVPNVVERWGDPDSSRCVLAASINDRKHDPLLAVARKSGLIEVLNPLTGDLQVSIINSSDCDVRPDDDAIIGLHMFKKQILESASRKGVELNVWDLDTCYKIWNAKSVSSLYCPLTLSEYDEQIPACKKQSWHIHSNMVYMCKCATFLGDHDHHKIVVGTNSHQVRLYDISSQRRPVISIDFRESPIKAITGGLDGHTIYIGTGSGDLAAIDMRTGKPLGCFVGKCSGSIRSIARHPELPVLASCGLDSYLRFWDVTSRQLLSAVFLKQHLSNVVFVDEEVASIAEDLPLNRAHGLDDTLDEDEEELLQVKRKKASKDRSPSKKLKSKKRSKKLESKDFDAS